MAFALLAPGRALPSVVVDVQQLPARRWCAGIEEPTERALGRSSADPGETLRDEPYGGVS
jgi:hypothetical protein